MYTKYFKYSDFTERPSKQFDNLCPTLIQIIQNKEGEATYLVKFHEEVDYTQISNSVLKSCDTLELREIYEKHKLCANLNFEFKGSDLICAETVLVTKDQRLENRNDILLGLQINPSSIWMLLHNLVTLDATLIFKLENEIGETPIYKMSFSKIQPSITIFCTTETNSKNITLWRFGDADPDRYIQVKLEEPQARTLINLSQRYNFEELIEFYQTADGPFIFDVYIDLFDVNIYKEMNSLATDVYSALAAFAYTGHMKDILDGARSGYDYTLLTTNYHIDRRQRTNLNQDKPVMYLSENVVFHKELKHTPLDKFYNTLVTKYTSDRYIVEDVRSDLLKFYDSAQLHLSANLWLSGFSTTYSPTGVIKQHELYTLENTIGKKIAYASIYWFMYRLNMIVHGQNAYNGVKLETEDAIVSIISGRIK